MNYFVRILLVNLCMVFALQVGAQSKTYSKTKKADKAFAVEEYNKAAELYKKAYSKTKNRALKAEITFKQAECYRLSGNTKRAESYYKRAVKIREEILERFENGQKKVIVKYKGKGSDENIIERILASISKIN